MPLNVARWLLLLVGPDARDLSCELGLATGAGAGAESEAGAEAEGEAMARAKAKLFAQLAHTRFV